MLMRRILQVIAPDQRHELLSRMILLELALHILLDDQAGFMISVDRFRPAGMYMMFPAEIYLESPGFGDVPLPWAKIYMVLLGPFNAVVSVELLAEVAPAVSRLYDAGCMFLSRLLAPPLRIQEISQ